MSNQLGTLLASIHTHIKSLSVVATQELETLIKDLDSTPEILDCISCVTVSLNNTITDGGVAPQCTFARTT